MVISLYFLRLELCSKTYVDKTTVTLKLGDAYMYLYLVYVCVNTVSSMHAAHACTSACNHARKYG